MCVGRLTLSSPFAVVVVDAAVAIAAIAAVAVVVAAVVLAAFARLPAGSLLYCVFGSGRTCSVFVLFLKGHVNNKIYSTELKLKHTN